MRRLSLALFIGALAVGCDKSPSTPTPPAGSPTPTPQAALSGLVRDRDTTAPLENARVEIVDLGSGSLTGNLVRTDATGRYSFFGISGSLSFRVSRDGYEGEPRRIHLALTPVANFDLMPVQSKPARETISVGETKPGTVDENDRTCGGMFFILPCKRFILIVSEAATLKARLTWPGAHDVDLELWQNDTLVDRSLICQACGQGPGSEEFTTFVPVGEYELRATLFQLSGSPAAAFTMSVTRVN